MILIDILIPTYNRSQDLLKNLHLLREQIEKDGLNKEVQIILSDNRSPDDTQKIAEDFMQNEGKHLMIKYFRNQENIGLERNVVHVLSKSEASYILWLGDDDFLADGYLLYCVEKIKHNQNIGCIISGLVSIDQNGIELGGREIPFQEKESPGGFKTALEYSHLGHQLSGLVMKREGLLKNYLAKPNYRNPYLFIYFVADRLLKYPMIYAPSYRTRVSVFNVKDWGYNGVGLLDEVYKSYYYFLDELGEEKVKDLLLRFTVVHSYRFAMQKQKPLRLFKQYQYLTNCVNLQGFKAGLINILMKDYILTWVK